MRGVMRFLTRVFGLGILVFGSALDSTEHFGAIVIALFFCITWCILYALAMQRSER